MDLTAHITKIVDDHLRAIARRKETLTLCALVDKRPALRWVEWQLKDGSVGHLLMSGGRGLEGVMVAGFRVEMPGTQLARDNGFVF